MLLTDSCLHLAGLIICRLRRCFSDRFSSPDFTPVNVGGAIRSIRASAEEIEYEVREHLAELRLSPLEEEQRYVLSTLLKGFDPNVRKEQLQRTASATTQLLHTAADTESQLDALEQLDLDEAERQVDREVGLDEAELTQLLDDMSRHRCDTGANHAG